MLIYRTNPAARGERRPYVPPMDLDDMIVPTVYPRPFRPGGWGTGERADLKAAVRPTLDLLERIKDAIDYHGLTDATFGREAVSDSNLVRQLHAGRRLRKATRDRIVQYLDRLEGC